MADGFVMPPGPAGQHVAAAVDGILRLAAEAAAGLNRSVTAGLSEMLRTGVISRCPKCGLIPVDVLPPEVVSRSCSSLEDVSTVSFRQRIRYGPDIEKRHTDRCEGKPAEPVQRDPICGDPEHRHFGPCENWGPIGG